MTLGEVVLSTLYPGNQAGGGGGGNNKTSYYELVRLTVKDVFIFYILFWKVQGRFLFPFYLMHQLYTCITNEFLFFLICLYIFIELNFRLTCSSS